MLVSPELQYERKGDCMPRTAVQPQRVVRRIPAFWIYGLLMILAVYTAVTCVRQESELQLLRRAKAEIQVKIDRELRKNEQLAEQKLEISSGDAIERLAREKLGYVKDGERIFVDANK
jgi:cell division protein FtsB